MGVTSLFRCFVRLDALKVIMNASLRSALVLGLVIGCSHSGADLFNDDGLPADSVGGGAAGNVATGSSSTGGSSGASTSQGGKVSGGASQGGTASAGKPASQGDAGEPPAPDGSAGAASEAGAGAGGESEQPPDPPEQPKCDNGKLEAGEECDDAGHAGEDGCDKCKVMCAHFGAGAQKSTDHHCYNGYDEANFDAAQAACKERGAHLVTISSAAENQVVRMLVNSSKLIGGFEDVDLHVEGKGDYGWITGEALSYVNWAPGEPNQEETRCGSGGIGGSNERCYQHCMAMNGQGRWEDHRCDQADGYVCEWEPAGQ